MAAKVKNFTGPNADEKAWRFGMFCIAVSGNKKALDFCKADGMPLAFLEDPYRPEAAGSILIPAEFIEDLAILRRKYGLFRADATCVKMESDSLDDPRQTGSKTLMVAKMRQTQFRYAHAMTCENATKIGDDIMDIACAFSLKEDVCGFFGDGCSMYGGIIGIDYFLKHHKECARIVGHPDFTLADLNQTAGVVAENANPTWYCSSWFKQAVMYRLWAMCGTDEESPALTDPHFLGYPVNTSQVFPSGSKPGQFACIFADMKQAAVLAYRDRAAINIAVDPSSGNSIVTGFDESDSVIDNLDCVSGLLSG